MPFSIPDIELPADFHVPCINNRPRDKRLANLRPGVGRPKGCQDKITRDLKEGIIEGAVQAGFDGQGEGGLVGYCRWMAMFHPKAYALLLAKLLPYNVAANVSSASINEVRILSIPSGQHLTKAAIDALEHDSTLQTMPADANLLEPTPMKAPVPDEAPEEEKIINNLKNEINELARKAGLGLVV
jgi:hypothetical protein